MLKKSLAFLAALTASVSADGDTGSNVGANGAPAPATPVISYARIDLQQVAVQQNEEGELMENAIITGKERTTPATCAYATPTLNTQNAPKVAYASGMFCLSSSSGEGMDVQCGFRDDARVKSPGEGLVAYVMR